MLGYTDSFSNSNKRGYGALGYDGADNSAKRPKPSGPSRVVHLRNLPPDCTENDLLTMCSPFGKVVNVLMLKGKNQAFVQMHDQLASMSMVEFYTTTPTSLRNHTVYLQYSNRDEITTPQSSNNETPNHILLATVTNMLYPTTIDVLHQVFSKYGTILKIVVFTKNGSFQALIQFSDIPSAMSAKAALDGQNIYVGCCALRIQYSNLTQLEVKFNNDKTRDFTNPNLPTGGPAPTMPAVMNPYGADFGAMGGMNFVHNPYGDMSMQMGQAKSQYGNSVLIVNGLVPERVTPDTLFTLFGVYGDVLRVKILFNKNDTALVQMSTPAQAEMVISQLNGVNLFGSELHINISKHNTVNASKGDGEQDGARYTKDYANSPLHRYKQVGSKNYQHICSPSPTLHISSIPPTATDAVLTSLFAQYGTVVGFKFFTNDKKMALLQMGSVREACEALISLHDYKVDPTSNAGIRVSFAKTSIHNTPPVGVAGSGAVGAGVGEGVGAGASAGAAGSAGAAADSTAPVPGVQATHEEEEATAVPSM